MDNTPEKYKLKLKELQRKEKYLEVINSFSKSLMVAETVNEIIWCVTDNAISQMGYQDCVVYLEEEGTANLIQSSAFGSKASGLHEIVNPIVIHKGRGIVGSVFSSGKGEIIKDTSKDNRYIQDDLLRLSEITIPIKANGKVIGIIDSEHANIGFFTQEDFNILTTIASMISIKIEKVKAAEAYKLNLEKAVKLKTKDLADANSVLKHKIDENEILIQEIHHRVKNNMQIIISLLSMHIKNAQTNHEKNVFKECSDRMHAIADIHGKVYFEKSLLIIDIKEFLFELTSEIITSYHKKKILKLKLNVEVESVGIDVAIPVGLILNELLLCTIKEGQKTKNEEDVEISLVSNESHLIVSYQDELNNFNLDKEDEFFGMVLVDILKEQLDAELEITKAGLKLIIPK